MEVARLSSLQMIQVKHFSSELMKLRRNQSIFIDILVSLNSILDSTGLIRICGQLRLADLNFKEKHPIILPSNHHVINIII